MLAASGRGRREPGGAAPRSRRSARSRDRLGDALPTCASGRELVEDGFAADVELAAAVRRQRASCRCSRRRVRRRLRSRRASQPLLQQGVPGGRVDDAGGAAGRGRAGTARILRGRGAGRRTRWRRPSAARPMSTRACSAAAGSRCRSIAVGAHAGAAGSGSGQVDEAQALRRCRWSRPAACVTMRPRCAGGHPGVARLGRGAEGAEVGDVARGGPARRGIHAVWQDFAVSR